MPEFSARALIGPNLYSDAPAAVAEFEPLAEGSETALAEAVADAIRPLAAAIGLALGPVQRRPFRRRDHHPGLGLAVTAPRDQVETAAQLLEQAIAVAHGAPPPTAAALAALREAADRERDPPALRALVAAATARELPTIVDDEAVSVGYGRRSLTWPRDQLPEITALDTLPWSELGTIPVALISGTNGKTTSARLLAAIAGHAGLRAGNSSTDGVAIAGELVTPGDWTGPGATRIILRRRDVDLAALEVARGGLLRRGLAVDRAAAALITNISDDHLDDYGICDLEAMAAVKAVIATVVSPSGRIILGADSPALATIDRQRLRAPIVWFARDPDHPRLRAHLADGGEVWYVADGCLVAAGPPGERPLVAVAAIPCTLGGAATHNVDNALGVSALACALGLPEPAIVGGLTHFTSSAADNPGRINRYHLRGTTVVIDFAHNLAGIRALAGPLRALRGAGRLTIGFGMAGDRSDPDLAALAAALGELEPDRICLRDQPDHLRGRAPGEVPAILRQALVTRGFAPDQITTATDERATIDAFLSDAAPGDLLAILAHTQRSTVSPHLAALGATPAP